ncbi:MAG: hypothetical protein Q7T72_07255 [Bacteroidales bacterium]|nr:hypothetical protein [Bacteroidales bacterium]MDP3002892.1 hypothetical protein [Bacteroidales bacterium]
MCLVNAETGVLSVLFSEQTWPYFNNEYTRITKEGANHSFTMSKSNKYFVDITDF